MAIPAERLWAAILRDVQHLMQGSETAKGPDAGAASPLLPAHFAGHAELYPRATWKKLVTDLKVSNARRSQGGSMAMP